MDWFAEFPFCLGAMDRTQSLTCARLVLPFSCSQPSLDLNTVPAVKKSLFFLFESHKMASCESGLPLMSHLSSSGNLYQFPKPRHQERMKLGTPSERTLFLLKLLAWLVTSYKKKGRVWVGHSKRFSCSLHEIKIYQDCRKILENLCLHGAPFSEYPSGKLMQA